MAKMKIMIRKAHRNKVRYGIGSSLAGRMRYVSYNCANALHSSLKKPTVKSSSAFSSLSRSKATEP